MSSPVIGRIYQTTRFEANFRLDSFSQSEPETGPSSEADSLDETVIRTKIDEANQLIARVKKALDKIRDRKPCEVKSSSTDIEETIRALKQETAQLITGYFWSSLWSLQVKIVDLP